MNSPYDRFKREISLLSELENQSDRGAAIVAAAWVEEGLIEAVRASLHPDQKSWNRLFGRSGPLDTFSAKIDIACLLGIISDKIRLDLHTVRDVRNEFAHSIVTRTDDVLNFNSPHIKDKCLSLRCVAVEKPNSGRAAFLRTCAVLNSDFHIYSKIVTPTETIYQIFARESE